MTDDVEKSLLEVNRKISGEDKARNVRENEAYNLKISIMNLVLSDCVVKDTEDLVLDIIKEVSSRILKGEWPEITIAFDSIKTNNNVDASLKEIADAVSLAHYLLKHPDNDRVTLSRKQFEILACYCGYGTIQVFNDKLYIIDDGIFRDMVTELGFDYPCFSKEISIDVNDFRKLLGNMSEQKEVPNQTR